jgi:hypothetical protein
MSEQSELVKALKKNKPTLSASSLRTYESILRNLYEKIEGKKEGLQPTYFCENYEKVIKFLQDMPFNKRKTLLAGLVSLCGSTHAATDQYRTVMLADIARYNADQKKQEKSPAQEKNWVTQTEIHDLYNHLYKDTWYLLKRGNVSGSEYERVLRFVLLSLYVLIPPRRIKDYIDFRIRNINKSTENYMDKNKFVFNSYKTAKTYETQMVKIPTQLRNIITLWSNINKSNELLVKADGRPLTQPEITLLLNRIFGKKVSVNILRHSFLSEVTLKNMPLFKDIEKDTEDMGTSIQQAMYTYKKE